MTNNDPQKLLGQNFMTTKDAGKKAGVSQRCIQRLASQGKINAWRVGGTVLVEWLSVLDYFNRAPVYRGRKPKNI